MPSRLLREPHLLAHELRTPLAVLGGWYSLIEAGDVTPATPYWDRAMSACRQAVDRLNVVIKQACDEATAINARDPETVERMERLMAETQRAIDHSWQILIRIRTEQTARLAEITRSPSPV